MLDEGVNILPENIDEFDDYYIYELSKHTDMDTLVYKFNTTKEAIQERIEMYKQYEAKIKATITGEKT